MRRVAVVCDTRAVQRTLRELVDEALLDLAAGASEVGASRNEPLGGQSEAAPPTLCGMTRRSLEEIRQTGGSDAATSLLIVLVEPCEICDPERASEDPSRRPPASPSVKIERAWHPSPGRLDAAPGSLVGSRRDTVALTSREIEVLRLIAEGLSSRAIAARLHISTRTADAHRLHIKRKLGASTIGQLVRSGIRGGYVAP